MMQILQCWTWFCRIWKISWNHSLPRSKNLLLLFSAKYHVTARRCVKTVLSSLRTRTLNSSHSLIQRKSGHSLYLRRWTSTESRYHLLFPRKPSSVLVSVMVPRHSRNVWAQNPDQLLLPKCYLRYPKSSRSYGRQNLRLKLSTFSRKKLRYGTCFQIRKRLRRVLR